MSLQRVAENTKIKNYLGCLHFSYATHHLTFNKSGLFPRNYKSGSSKISFFSFFFKSSSFNDGTDSRQRSQKEPDHHLAPSQSNDNSQAMSLQPALWNQTLGWLHQSSVTAMNTQLYISSLLIHKYTLTHRQREKINHFMHFSVLPCSACYQSVSRDILHLMFC